MAEGHRHRQKVTSAAKEGPVLTAVKVDPWQILIFCAPPEGADDFSARHAPEHLGQGDHVLHLAVSGGRNAADIRRIRIRERSLGDDQRLAVAHCRLGEAVAEVVEAAMPKWVVAFPNDVELDLLLQQVVEEPLGSGPVATTVNMNDNSRHLRASSILNPHDGVGQQLGELGPLRSGVIRAAYLAVGPEEAADDFVAHLDVIGHRARCFESGNAVAVILAHLVGELGEGQAGPGRRFGLLPWVGPGIRIVEVQHQLESGVLHALRQWKSIVEVVDVVVRIGLCLRRAARKQPQPHAGQAVVLQNCQAVPRLPAIPIDNPARLEECQVREISAGDEAGG